MNLPIIHWSEIEQERFIGAIEVTFIKLQLRYTINSNLVKSSVIKTVKICSVTYFQNEQCQKKKYSNFTCIILLLSIKDYNGG